MSTKKRVTAIAIVGAIVILLVGLKIVSSAFNAPVHGTISTTATKSTPTVQATINLRPKTATGTYAHFNYPSGLTKDKSNAITPPVVAIYDFSYRDIESWDLAISIAIIPSGQLSDNNAYQFRKINPSTYQASQLVLNHTAIPVMTDKTVSGFSKVAFLIQGQYQATHFLTG